MSNIVSYNVHGCRGRDGRHDIARCAAVVARLRPVIVGLQEVDSRDGEDAWTIFESRLEMHAVPGPTLPPQAGTDIECRTIERETRLPDGQVIRDPITACRDPYDGTWEIHDSFDETGY